MKTKEIKEFCKQLQKNLIQANKRDKGTMKIEHEAATDMEEYSPHEDSMYWVNYRAIRTNHTITISYTT